MSGVSEIMFHVKHFKNFDIPIAKKEEVCYSIGRTVEITKEQNILWEESLQSLIKRAA